VDVSPAVGEPGSDASVTLSLFNVTDLYGLQAECTVNPAILQGTVRTDGAAFDAATSFFVDQGFQSDGKWVVAASRLHPNPAVSGNFSAFTLHYTAAGEGTTPVECTVLGVDDNGREIALEIINGTFEVRAVAPTPLPTVPPLPTEPPVATPSPTEIPLPTETPAPTETPVPGEMAVIGGTAAYQNAPDNAGITVQLMSANTVLAELTTTETGKFEFQDVPVGEYQLMVNAPLHLTLTGAVTVSADGLHVDAGTFSLPAGDTDDNRKIDILDASWVGINFGGAAAAAPNADLNRDSQINVRDLVLIGGNFALEGPLTQ
jgi:hypothetical protein